MAVHCGLSLRMLWMSCLLISSVTCLPAREGYGSPAPRGYMHWSSSSDSSVPRAYLPLRGSVNLAPTGNDARGVGSRSGNLALGLAGSVSAGYGSPAPSGSSSGSSVPRAYPPLRGSVNLAPTGNDARGVGSGSGNTGLGLVSSVSAGYGSPASGGSSSDSSIPREYLPSLRGNVNLAPTGNDARGVGSGNPGLGLVGTGSSSSESTGGDDGHVDFSSEGEERPQPVFSDVSNMEPVHIFRSRSRYRNGRRHFSKTHYTPGEMMFPPRRVVD